MLRCVGCRLLSRSVGWHTYSTSLLSAMSAPAASSAASALASSSDVAWRPQVPLGHSAFSWAASSHSPAKHHPHHHHKKHAHAHAPAAAAAVAPAAKVAPITPAAEAASASAKPAPAKQRAPKQPKQPNPPKAQKAAAFASASVVASSAGPSLLLHPQAASLQMIDIGANLTDDMFSGHYRGKAAHANDLHQVLERARERQVDRVIVTAGSAPEAITVLDLVASLQAADEKSSRFPHLFSTVGVHPTRSKEWDGDAAHQKRYLESLEASIARGLATTPRTVVAIGECGLDYDRLHFSGKATQLAHFEKHFDLVESVHARTGVSLPLFLHDRNTAGDFAEILRRNRHRFKHGVVHSFTGTIEELKAHLALDLYIGINGCSLKTAENLEALNHIPLDRLMLETDAPWCSINSTHAGAALVSTESKMKSAKDPMAFVAGQAVRGRNEPANMVQVLEVVSRHLGMDGLELAAICRKNTMRVFFPDEFQKLEEAEQAVAASSSSA